MGAAGTGAAAAADACCGGGRRLEPRPGRARPGPGWQRRRRPGAAGAGTGAAGAAAAEDDGAGRGRGVGGRLRRAVEWSCEIFFNWRWLVLTLAGGSFAERPQSGARQLFSTLFFLFLNLFFSVGVKLADTILPRAP